MKKVGTVKNVKTAKKVMTVQKVGTVKNVKTAKKV